MSFVQWKMYSKCQMYQMYQTYQSVLIPLALTVATSAADAAIKTKFFVFGMIALIIWNNDMDNIMKTVKSLKNKFYW